MFKILDRSKGRFGGGAEPELLPPSAAEAQGIAAIVRRIEAFRRSREAGTRQFGESGTPLDRPDPQLPLHDERPLAPATPGIS